MKLYILISAFLIFPFSKETENSNDFDSQLTQIVHEFKTNIMDKNKCEELKRKAYYLSDEIQHSIDGDENSEYEENKLVQLKKETEAVEEFIASVGNCGNFFPKIETIYLANNRINSSISTLVKEKFCTEIISISLNGYVATMAFNNSFNDFTISYNWKALKGMSTGSGTMGLPSRAVRHIYDNRSKPALKTITIISISCKSY